MSVLDSALEPVFAPVEQAFDEEVSLFRLCSGIAVAAKEAYGTDSIPPSIRSEHFVLNLSGRMRVQQPGWGEYFGPTFGPGQPNVTEVDLSYWLERAQEATHPQLRARYADAVWDLTRASIGTKPPIESACIAVDAYLDACERLTGARIECRLDWLDRALQLAVSTNNSVQKLRCVQSLIDVATASDSIRAWMRAYGTVFRIPKVKASDEQKACVIDGLQRHAEAELSADSLLPFQGEESSLEDTSLALIGFGEEDLAEEGYRFLPRHALHLFSFRGSLVFQEYAVGNYSLSHSLGKPIELIGKAAVQDLRVVPDQRYGTNPANWPPFLLDYITISAQVEVVGGGDDHVGGSQQGGARNPHTTSRAQRERVFVSLLVTIAALVTGLGALHRRRAIRALRPE